MNSFRIISFDGGGIRGVIATGILKKLCSKYPELTEKTDMFAGTSTGGLIAIALACGRNADYIDNLYCYENIKNIFRRPHLNLITPKYNDMALKRFLKETIPENLTIEDVEKYLFIPSFNVKGNKHGTWTPVFFNNLSDNLYSSCTLIDSALATCAAPTYFPSHKNFIDGGVVANNPSMISMIYAMKYLKPRPLFKNIKILSIGTGSDMNKLSESTRGWGALQWAVNPLSSVKMPLVSIMLNDGDLSHIYCSELLKDNYFRVNPRLKTNIAIDDYKIVPDLKNEVKNLDLTRCYKYIEDNFLK